MSRFQILKEHWIWLACIAGRWLSVRNRWRPDLFGHRLPVFQGEIIMCTYQDYVLDALELVLPWDLPDEELAAAVNAQAKLMAGINPEEISGWPSEPSIL